MSAAELSRQLERLEDQHGDLLRGDFGELELKGFGRPVAACEVRGLPSS